MHACVDKCGFFASSFIYVRTYICLFVREYLLVSEEKRRNIRNKRRQTRRGEDWIVRHRCLAPVLPSSSFLTLEVMTMREIRTRIHPEPLPLPTIASLCQPLPQKTPKIPQMVKPEYIVHILPTSQKATTSLIRGQHENEYLLRPQPGHRDTASSKVQPSAAPPRAHETLPLPSGAPATEPVVFEFLVEAAHLVL